MNLTQTPIRPDHSAFAASEWHDHPFMRAGGFAVLDDFPDQATVAQLYAEARDQYASSDHQENWEPDYEEGRGGKPQRRLLTAEAGVVQDRFYRSGALEHLLSEHCSMKLAVSGSRGSYSYYVRPGDFLDLHLDVDTCDVTMITVLLDQSQHHEPGGSLVLYPGRIGEPLSWIRERPEEGAVAVKLIAGQSIVLMGGLVPHRVVPVAAGQMRVISVLCFKATPRT